LPALLSLLGDRVNALRLPVFGRTADHEESPFWSRAVGGVLKRPLISLVLATAILLVMAAPVLGQRSGEAGVSTLPDRLAAKQGYVALNAEFPGETTEPVEVVIGCLFVVGLFFLIAGRLSSPSLDRRGPARFARERLIRLGTPVLAYTLLVSPALEYFDYRENEGGTRGFWSFFGDQIWHLGPGPTWFLEALLAFSLGYALLRGSRPRGRSTTGVSCPNRSAPRLEQRRRRRLFGDRIPEEARAAAIRRRTLAAPP
jgi:Acyltransferase family